MLPFDKLKDVGLSIMSNGVDCYLELSLIILQLAILAKYLNPADEWSRLHDFTLPNNSV